MTTPIVLIAGAPASGKSTASRGLAARFARSIAINVDDLRSMVVAGVVHPGAVWTDELVEQLHLARQSAVAMAQRYHAAGFAVVIDDFYDPASRLREYDDLAHAGMVRVLLYPAAQKAHAQNLQRSGPGPCRHTWTTASASSMPSWARRSTASSVTAGSCSTPRRIARPKRWIGWLRWRLASRVTSSRATGRRRPPTTVPGGLPGAR